MGASNSHILGKNKTVLIGQTSLRLCQNNSIRLLSLFIFKAASKELLQNVKDLLYIWLPTDIKGYRQGRLYQSFWSCHFKSLVIKNSKVPHINHGGKIYPLGLLQGVTVQSQRLMGRYRSHNVRGRGQGSSKFGGNICRKACAQACQR